MKTQYENKPTKKLILKAMNKSTASSCRDQRHSVRVDIVLRSIISPLLTRRPFAGLKTLALPIMCTPLVLTDNVNIVK